MYGAQSMSADGLITIHSAHSVKDTIDRFEAAAKARGMVIFARIDHAAGAKDVGMQLRPTLLLIFGHAKGGTPLMQVDQQVGIDLPLKALAWEDDSGRTWLSYNDPFWLAGRHHLGAQAGEAVKQLSAALEALSTNATADA
jgi:uncharacterized protein (DUF302 family)